MVRDELQNLGLSDKEASVYLAALELGTDTVQRIAAKAKVKRVTTYVVLETLMKKGLVSKVEKEKKTFYVAEEPERLGRFLDALIKELNFKKNNLAPLLKQLSLIDNVKTNKPIVRFFEGREGVDTLIDDFYKELASEKEKTEKNRAPLYLAYSRDLLNKYFPPEEIKKNRDVRVKANVEAIALFNQAKSDEKFIKSKSYRLSDKNYPFPCDIAIFKDKIRMISLGSEPSAILIIDKNLACGMESLFRLAEEGAKNAS